MALRKCPACGAAVKVENLNRHLADVHPGRDSARLMPERERADLRLAAQKAARPPRMQFHVKPITIVLAVIAVVIIAALAVFGVPRLPPSGMEDMFHVHATLRITINGQPVTVPKNIGIDPSTWRDHSLDGNSMMAMSPLHTHDTTGKIHIESEVTWDYTIGEFFQVWGQSFDANQVLGHTAGPGHEVTMVVDGANVPVSQSTVLRDGTTIDIRCDVA